VHVKLSPQALARWSARRKFTVIGIWIALFLVGGLLAGRYLNGALTTQADFTNNPDSKQARTLLEQKLTGPHHATELVIVRSNTLTVQDPAFRAYVERLTGSVQALGPAIIAQTVNPDAAKNPQLISADRHATLIPVTMAGTLDDATDHAGQLLRVTADAQHPAGFQVNVAGEATAGKDSSTIAEQDLKKGETIGIAAAAVILVLVFGALAAAVLPIVLAIMSIAVALGIVSLLGLAFHFSFFVTNMITMMGLAVGIDYSLFIVSRYREERARGRERIDAVTAAGATANRAVFFSGLTVVLALAGMLLIPTTIFRSLATGAIAVVLVAVFASLTLLPALLALMGDRVNALRVPVLFRRRMENVDRTSGFWAGVASRVMGRPVLSLLLATGVLVAVALPLFGIKTGFSGVSTFPDNMQSKQAFTILARDFSGGLTQPAQIVVDGEVRSAPVSAAIERLRGTLRADHSFGPSALQVNPAGDLALISVPVTGDPNGPAATDAVRHLRSADVPQAFAGVDASVLVGGQTAQSVDFFHLTDRYTPIVLAFVLGLSFLLLTVVFRSVLVPLLGVLLNLLSAGAAYGLLVLVNQHGTGAGVLGFQQVPTIESWLPLFLFSVLFGLSMDYQVFLLSRIRERYDQTGDNVAAVSFGLRTTGGIITGAALIMVAVFGGFATGRLVMLQELGFGLATAVLIDATIVRSVLVPAALRLLGRRNWYLPSWLHWLPQLRVEAPAAQPVRAEPEPELEPVS
jgi:RND superfamily putative drug exporter